MIEFIAHNLAPIIFFSLVIFLLLGYPVAFALAANGLLFFLVGVELSPYSNEIRLAWPLLYAMPERLWGIMSNDTLLAIPFFTFMGLVLERSGMAEDLLDTVGQLFGPIRGGLAYAVILVGALLAATTGVVAASVIAMGLISLPIMLRYGYDRRVASGVIAASGTLAQIIPPSLVLIIMADQLGRSVGDMYAGAIIPGLVLTSLYLSYVLLVSLVKPEAMPALPMEARTLGSGVLSFIVLALLAVAVSWASARYLQPYSGDNATIWGVTIGTLTAYIVAVVDKALGINMLSRLAQQVTIVLIPPLALIFLVLGTIFLGIATPTEGGAMGAVGAMIMAAAKRKLTFDVVSQALTSTTRLSAFVLFILIGARVFSLTFYGVNGHVWVEELLTSVPGGELGFLIVVNLIIFLLAFFLDFFELSFIVVPLLVAPAQALGIDLIWLGVLLGVNMQTSFMHPPFGFALFYLRSVAAKAPYIDKITKRRIEPVTTGQIYWGAVPFVIIQVIMVGLTIAFPQMVMHYKDEGPAPGEEIKIELPPLGGAQPGQGAGGALGTQPAPGTPSLQLPGELNLNGTPPALQPQGTDAGGGAPAQPATPAPAIDLSQPPKITP
jgi:TRAP-type mannitol/chloroaromatic compound transport system permease large subunit